MSACCDSQLGYTKQNHTKYLKMLPLTIKIYRVVVFGLSPDPFSFGCGVITTLCNSFTSVYDGKHSLLILLGGLRHIVCLTVTVRYAKQEHTIHNSRLGFAEEHVYPSENAWFVSTRDRKKKI